MVIRWAVTNAAMAALIYFGLYKGIDGAQNVLLFWVWLTLPMALTLISDDSKEVLRKRGRAVPAGIDAVLDIAAIAALLWFGWMWTAAAYTLANIIAHGAMEDAINGQSARP